VPHARPAQQSRPCQSANIVVLGPKIDLHVGAHDALAEVSSPRFQHRRKDCVHVFLMAGDADKSPFSSFHLGEFVDFGPGQAVVHTARWPVLNRRAWVTDTDDFVYPVVCGRYFLDRHFRIAFRQPWSPVLKNNILKRIDNMLTAYAHPSCKSIIFRSQYAVGAARSWLKELERQDLAEAYLSKVQVVYPVRQCCPEKIVERKWRTLNGLTVVFCGRDYDTKNGGMALRIFERLILEAPATRFVYIGGVPTGVANRYRDLFGRIEYHENMPHKQVLAVLSGAHVLFHPTQFEGLGIVFLEAMAAGMAVVTATGDNMRPVEELFATGGAILVDRATTARSEESGAFENHLRFVLNRPDVARSMAYENFRSASVGNLSIERNRKILLKIYEDALEHPAKTPLRLAQIPHISLAAVTRFSSRQLQDEEWAIRQHGKMTQSRFLL
jgi:glycosyltransferase involved in cell wall biosynthesis